MNRNTILGFTIGAVTFIAAAALAFWVGSAIAGDDPAPPAALPAFEEPIPVIVPIPFEGDPVIAAATLAEQVSASRAIASEIGVTLEPANPSGIKVQTITGTGDAGIPTETSTDDETTDTTSVPAADSDGSPAPPPAGTPPAEERVIDSCIEGGEGCPEGISGTILAIHALPPLSGVPEFRPAAPGSGYSYRAPECPPQELEEGAAYFGVSTTRPAIIAMEYRSDDWAYGRGYTVPWTTFETTTPDGAEVAWNEWWADESATETDRRAWIQHCFTLEDLPAGARYIARFTYTDKYDPSIVTTGFARVRFSVPGRGALLPGAQRRPTTVLPLGLDQLFVGMTREPDQDIAVAAREGTDPAMCNVAGDTRSIYSGAGTVRAVVTSDDPIDRDVLDDPAYPYFVRHSQSVVTRLDLQEGTNYVVCVYWLAEGPAFDPRVVEIAESIPVSTPEAYRPTIVLHGLTNLIGDVGLVQVRIPGCGTHDFNLAEPSATVRGRPLSHDRAGILQTTAPAIEMCTLTHGLTEIDRRGIRVDTLVVVTGATTSESSGAYIRTDLECRTATCLIRFPEMALVALPRIPVDESDCGSGFGVGCLSDGMRTAGDVIIEIQFDATAGTGISSWDIGGAAEFDDTPPPLAENPQIAFEKAIDLIERHPRNGAQATITVLADRPVTLSVSLADTSDTCSLGNPDGYDSTTLSATHSFTLGPLCLGLVYQFAVSATDESGRSATIVGESSLVPEGLVELSVPLVAVTTELTATITVPTNDRLHTVTVRPVRARTDDARIGGTFVRSLYWTWPESDRTAARIAGWELFGVDGEATACGSAGARPLEVFGRRAVGGGISRSNLYVNQDGTEITVLVDIYQNQLIRRAVFGECVPGDLIEGVELTAAVSVDDLLAGVTLSSESGSVVFTITATGFRSELGG